MTRYDRVPGHPLAGVPQRILNAARAVLGAAPDADLRDADDRADLADAVVLALHQEGHVTWSTSAPSVPDREALVLACQSAAAWRPDEGSSVMEAVVDEVILPLLRRATTSSEPTPSRQP